MGKEQLYAQHLWLIPPTLNQLPGKCLASLWQRLSQTWLLHSIKLEELTNKLVLVTYLSSTPWR